MSPVPVSSASISEDARRIRLRRFAGPAIYAEQLEHVRVAHLTDLHVGAVTPLRVQHAAVERTNAEAPDLVLVTGDFVCHGRAYLPDLEGVIRGLRAPVIAVLGNHDHWSGAAAVRRALRRAGAEVLANQHTSITIRGQTLQVVGLDDAFTGHARRDDAVRGMRRDLATIGLSHIGEEADGLWAEGVPLVLAGHTHAGQVNVGRVHDVLVGTLGGHRYVHGLYGTRARVVGPYGAVYVGAGVGASFIPLRLGERAQREVAIFELGVLPGSFAEHHGEQTPRRRGEGGPRWQGWLRGRHSSGALAVS
jgi:predicted MPP superfamily phosphohydrolase